MNKITIKNEKNGKQKEIELDNIQIEVIEANEKVGLFIDINDEILEYLNEILIKKDVMIQGNYHNMLHPNDCVVFFG